MRELTEAIQAARARHPGVEVDDEAFLAHLRGRLAKERPMSEALPEVDVGDLLIAYACGIGEPRALLVFEECLRGCEGALVRRGIAADQIDEAKQNVRARMLVGDGEPRVFAYNGLGDLKSWLR